MYLASKGMYLGSKGMYLGSKGMYLGSKGMYLGNQGPQLYAPYAVRAQAIRTAVRLDETSAEGLCTYALLLRKGTTNEAREAERCSLNRALVLGCGAYLRRWYWGYC